MAAPVQWDSDLTFFWLIMAYLNVDRRGVSGSVSFNSGYDREVLRIPLNLFN